MTTVIGKLPNVGNFLGIIFRFLFKLEGLVLLEIFFV